MHKARVEADGSLRCRSCGSEALLAKTNERQKRTKHLKCEECGEHQRYREPKGERMSAPSAPSPSAPPTPDRPPRAGTPRHAEPTRDNAPTLGRISWRSPEARVHDPFR
jgi:hypothetical protein